MNVKNEISEELRSLSALVASIDRLTPYQAPEGYFMAFPDQALQMARVSSSGTVPGFQGPKSLGFSVPDGYFEGFAAQVLNKIKSGAAPVSAGAEKFASGGEFDELPAILAQAGRNTPYQIPQGYFDTLSPVLT